MLICPVCGDALADEGRALRCPAGHAFDRAREGYVDLLPAGHGRSRITGDSPEMVRARRRFLEGGHYAPVADAIAELALPSLAGPARELDPPVVVDAGCGEGWYLGRLAAALPPATGAAPCLLGFDVARDAVRLASRTHPEARFFVNDVTRRICVRDGAADLLLNVFAPRAPEEFARVVRKDGRALVVVPQEGHLGELRTVLPLLRIDEDKRERTLARLGGAFDLVAEREVACATALGAQDLGDLARMTPSARHLRPGDYERVARLAGMNVTVAVRVLALARRP